ncbi:MAG TPA: hypothetical protein VF023_01785 [Bryobacteraceae bacterium]
MSSEDRHGALEPKPVIDEPPPILRTWPRLYSAVLGYLAALIAVLYTFTRWFSH